MKRRASKRWRAPFPARLLGRRVLILCARIRKLMGSGQRRMKILDKKIIKSEPIAGGCISNAMRVQTEAGDWFFCKTSEKRSSVFLEEARGLVEIASQRVITVPEVIEADEHKLVLQWIETATPNAAFWKTLGYKLARLHVQLHEVYGFPIANHIGSTPQANPLIAMSDTTWADYFLQYRLQALLDHPKFAHDDELQSRFKQAQPVIRQHLLEVNEPPSLLHGDLWSGNVICARTGNEPVLIDPAPYFGHREADLAMTELFGGFPPEFYASYRAEFPVQPAYEQRKPIYNLYHRLNHWLLFGDTYRAGCLATLRSFAN